MLPTRRPDTHRGAGRRAAAAMSTWKKVRHLSSRCRKWRLGQALVFGSLGTFVLFLALERFSPSRSRASAECILYYTIPALSVNLTRWLMSAPSLECRGPSEGSMSSFSHHHSQPLTTPQAAYHSQPHHNDRTSTVSWVAPYEYRRGHAAQGKDETGRDGASTCGTGTIERARTLDTSSVNRRSVGMPLAASLCTAWATLGCSACTAVSGRTQSLLPHSRQSDLL